jgi:hypothetical protein
MYYHISEHPNHIHHQNRKSKKDENWLKMNILKLQNIN